MLGEKLFGKAPVSEQKLQLYLVRNFLGRVKAGTLPEKGFRPSLCCEVGSRGAGLDSTPTLQISWYCALSRPLLKRVQDLAKKACKVYPIFW